MKRYPCPDLRVDREAVLAKVRAKSRVLPNGCWEWTGHVSPTGYGKTSWRNRGWTVTRLLYCATVGEFDPALDICHTCDNPPCVNPDHLWLGTRSDNIQDSKAKGRHALASATHCRRGHELSGDNLYIKPDGKRGCKICLRASKRIRAGWPAELAYSTDTVPHGYQVAKANWNRVRSTGNGRQPKSHCKNGHAMVGDNVYVVPSDGRRQCRRCKHEVVKQIAERRKARG